MLPEEQCFAEQHQQHRIWEQHTSIITRVTGVSLNKQRSNIVTRGEDKVSPKLYKIHPSQTSQMRLVKIQGVPK